MAENNNGWQRPVYEANESPETTETTPLLQTSLSELDITILTQDTTEPYIFAAINEFKSMIASSSRTIFTTVLQGSFIFTNIVSVGHLGAEKLAAMALAMTFQGIIVLSPIHGLLSAMDTFCSTAYTASQDKTLVGFHYQRGIIAVLSHFMLLLPILWNAESLFLLLRQEPEIACLAGLYLKINILGLIPLALLETTKRFLLAQGITHVTTIIVVVIAPIQWISNITLVRSERFGIGFIGAPIVNIISNWLMFIGIILYTRYSHAAKAWGGWKVGAFHNMWAYYKFAAPSIITMCASWTCFELLTLGSSHFGTNQIAGNAIMINTVEVIFQFSNGLGFSICPQIGNLIGAAKPRQTRIAADVAVLASIFLGLMGVLFLGLCGNWWISVYTRDPSVAYEAAKLVAIVCMFSMCNSLNTILSAILRGLGRQKYSANTLLSGFYICGVPIGAYLAYVRQIETAGLWWGLFAGSIVASTLHIVYIYLIVDWKDEVHLCILRLKANSSTHTNDIETQ